MYLNFLQSKMNYRKLGLNRKLCLDNEIISAKRLRVKLRVPYVLLGHTEAELKLPLNIAFEHFQLVKVVACEYATAMMMYCAVSNLKHRPTTMN